MQFQSIQKASPSQYEKGRLPAAGISPGFFQQQNIVPKEQKEIYGGPLTGIEKGTSIPVIPGWLTIP